MVEFKQEMEYAGKILEVVPNFTNLGLKLTKQLSLTQRLVIRLLRTIGCLYHCYHNYININQCLKMFTLKYILDTKIPPLLLYGTEVWGTDCQNAVERVHNYACKRYMCIRLKAVLGDCWPFLIYITAAKRCIKYSLKFLECKTIGLYRNIT